MVQCEMCGAETTSPKTAKIEGAELQVCADCVEFGTEVQQSDSSNDTKYSTSDDSSTKQTTQQTTTGSKSQASRSKPRRDLFDEMEEIVEDFNDRIRAARESQGLTQAELADQLNEKTSLIRKLERGDHLPSDTVRRKLERALEIELIEGGSSDDDVNSWSSSGEQGGVTLGDIVKRKD